MCTADSSSRILRRRWYHFSAQTIVLLTALFAVALGLIFYYRVHLWWWLCADRAQLSEVQAVPTGPMPDTPPPDDWLQCRVGSLAFKLPAAMTKDIEVAKTGAPIFVFRDGSRRIILDLPRSENGDVLDILTMHPQAKGVSLPRLRLACYQASSDDFRWSMSPEEVSWHAWCITACVLLRHGNDGYVETMFRDDLDGIAHFNDGDAAFDWQSSENGAWSFMSFRDFSGHLDPAWVRTVCQSLRFSGETYPDSMPKEKLLGLFQVLSK
jgi:hypothetical protein